MGDKEKRLIIIDGNSLVHRAYHALPPLTTKKGELINAVYGFLLVFLRALRELSPDFIAATFDFPATNFRHEKFKGYKATRPKAPEELFSQIPKVKEILNAFGIPIFEKEGFEADDTISTLAKEAARKQVFPPLETIIVSGDLDTLQLVDKKTKAYILRKGVKDIVLYDENLVKEKYQGLEPGQLVDFRALRGDPSDNIPGVPGVGEKTAIALLLKFGSLENLYQELEEKTEKAKEISPKTRELLINFKEQAFLSKELAETQKNVPLDFNLQECLWGDYDKEKVIKTFQEFEFYSLINRLP